MLSLATLLDNPALELRLLVPGPAGALGREALWVHNTELPDPSPYVRAGEIVLTSMDADGTRAGYDLEMTRAVSEAVGIPVVASGGAGSPEHLYLVLTEGKADAALAASIFHYNEYPVPVTKKYLAERGVAIRI